MRRDIPQIVLASASPRRKELLDQIGVNFSIKAANIDETPLPGEQPMPFVERMALSKALAVQKEGGSLPVLGADTIVVCDERIMGKPVDSDEAFAMWKRMSGTTHEVITAVALLSDDQSQVVASVSEVSFRHLGEPEMMAYWNSGEPTDKAGGYAIQGLGAVFVSHLKGSFSGVVGLPLFETDRLLRQFGIGRV